jgi:rhodanese-related sulfurtransferase
MTLRTISPKDAKRLIESGAVLIDDRAPDEHARERITGARNHPLNALHSLDSSGTPVIFHCRSGQRTAANATRLADAAQCEAYLLEGGLDAWRRAGLPVAADRTQPIEIMRQVQIVAGSFVLFGLLLGATVASAFYLLSAFIGAGLIFAGVSGWCGMAKLLDVMPWNRKAAV